MKECPACRRCFPDDVNHCPNDGDATTVSIPGEPGLDGRYQLERRLGQGGMGVVYQARHIFLKTSHAIKVILPDLVGNDPMLVTRFRQEAMAAAAIRHQNIIAVTDFGVARGTMPFLVMEFIKGTSLHDLLAREKVLAPEVALEIMSAIGAGVGAAHRQGIVHRDLKPLNIMMQDNTPISEGLKVLDFGLAKIKSGELLGSFIQAQTSGLMGSPYYMAPEQWSDEEPDACSDIYSLGVMLYQMLGGDVPFKGASVPSIMKKHLSLDPAPLRDLGASVSPPVEAVVRHALEKEPGKRPRTVEVLVEEFRQAVNEGVSPKSSSDIHVSSLPPIPGPAAAFPSERIAETQPPSGSGPADFAGVTRIAGRPAATDSGRVGGLQATQNQRSGVVTGAVAESSLPGADGSSNKLGEAASLSSATGALARPSKSRARVLVYVATVLALLALGGGGYGFYYYRTHMMHPAVARTTDTPLKGRNLNSNERSDAPLQLFNKPDLAAIPGGSFHMGRNDGPPQEAPAHTVTVKDFWMDRTEVTNGEYSQFVKETGHPAPAQWVDGKPLAGQEQWPVTSVSVDDANAFAAWRSKRDGVAYRLPTEEEWEYAARSGDQATLYPWGNSFAEDRAVVKAASPRGVGACPAGANRWGVLDLIGNVWEWTSSKAALYPGNPAQLPPGNQNWIVIRGGSYASDPFDPRKPITASFRDWVSASTRNPVLGFRLVR